MGTNVSKLIVRFVAREAIPFGGGLADAVEFFSNPDHRQKVLERAKSQAMEAIRLIKSAPDNPFGDDDEQIAGEILKRLERTEKP